MPSFIKDDENADAVLTHKTEHYAVSSEDIPAVDGGNVVAIEPKVKTKTKSKKEGE